MALFRRPKSDAETAVPAIVSAHTPINEGLRTGTRDAPTGSAAIRERLARQLAILEARTATREFDELELQLIVQVHREQTPGSYATFRSQWERRFRGTRFGVANWVQEIEPLGWAGVVVPMRAGTISLAPFAPAPPRPKALKGGGSAVTRRPRPFRPVADPLVFYTTHRRNLTGSSPELMGMDVIANWFGWTPPEATVLAAPPIFEYVRANTRTVLAAETVSWGLDWPLPAAALPGHLDRPST